MAKQVGEEEVDTPWRVSSSKPLPKIHHSPVLRLANTPYSLHALSVVKHPNPVGAGLASDAVVEAAGPDCVIPGQIVPVRVLGLKLWPIDVDLKFIEPVGRQLKLFSKFMDGAVAVMDKSYADR